MAEITKGTTFVPSPCTFLPGYEHQYADGLAGEDIAAGDLVYIKASDGRLWRASGAAANAAALHVGMAGQAAKAGEALTYWFGVSFYYADSLTPATRLYLSGTVAGGLADAASTGGTTPAAIVLPDGENLTSSKIYVLPITK